ncbi:MULTISPECIES: hypothetical protein [Stenotrophomonas]|uniref:hypothetical protein n=1 Tax=Stenotrophomonas TaxID=40323 RepID=UPI000872B02B|nr:MULTISPECIES: hypothetical protein [Stenotrophomonas]OEZ01755.1 hypothetical protein BIY45_04775 [Stenotrophomonas sp. BIIR7]
MTQLQIVGIAAFVGPAYLLFLFVVGATLGHRWTDGILCRWERAGATLVTGLLAHALVASILLLVAPRWSGISLWLLLAGCIVRWRWYRPTLTGLVAPVLLVTSYGLACYLLLLSFHYGPARGSTIFWSIYSLTNVTPGDSPQGAFQAQYLLFGSKLVGGEDFALFDRPFLGGIITAGTLPAFGISFSSKFYDYPDLVAFAYTNLWIAINAIVVLPLLHIVDRFSRGRTAFVVSLLLLACPFLVFNSIGLWSKLLALALMCLAGTSALRRNWIGACLISSVAFFTHGSFLWAHISFCGVIFFTLIVESLGSRRWMWRQIFSVLILSVAVPAIWFTAEHLSGGATPLRTYYLYNVHVAYGLHHSAEAIAREFYASTNATNLVNLPWINVAKGVLPIEVLDLVINYRLIDDATGWRALGDALFRNQFMRAWFALGLVGGLVTWRGLFSHSSSRWVPRLAFIAFFLLPLIPGLGLYRRDDHFLLPIMMFAIIPVLISFCIGLESVKPRSLILLALVMLCEYMMIYFWRYPVGRFVGEFHAYYVAAAVLGMIGVGSCIVSQRPRWLPIPGAAQEVSR